MEIIGEIGSTSCACHTTRAPDIFPDVPRMRKVMCESFSITTTAFCILLVTGPEIRGSVHRQRSRRWEAMGAVSWRRVCSGRITMFDFETGGAGWEAGTLIY